MQTSLIHSLETLHGRFILVFGFNAGCLHMPGNDTLQFIFCGASFTLSNCEYCRVGNFGDHLI